MHTYLAIGSVGELVHELLEVLSGGVPSQTKHGSSKGREVVVVVQLGKSFGTREHVDANAGIDVEDEHEQRQYIGDVWQDDHNRVQDDPDVLEWLQELGDSQDSQSSEYGGNRLEAASSLVVVEDQTDICADDDEHIE